MSIQNELRSCPPDDLVGARCMMHKAAQLVTMAARANLEAVPDDSHSNLGWDRTCAALLSHVLSADDEDVAVGLVPSNLTLLLAKNGTAIADFALADTTDDEAYTWLDAQLVGSGLQPASAVSLPYELPTNVAEIGVYTSHGLERPLSALGAWFALADRALGGFAAERTDIVPGPSAVRCWPHHFDIATYVALEASDAETARGIGVGMSPGDETYAQPYFYVNPWPHLVVSDLPEPPLPGHWHTQGFVGAIATASEVLALEDIESGVGNFIAEAFAIGRQRLGV